MTSDLTPRQRRAIEALLEGCTQRDAAKRAGVGERTLRRWMAENGRFCAELRAAEAERLAHTLRKLAALADEAVNTLRAGLRGDATGTQVRAADTALRLLLSLREQIDIEQRLQRLEQEVLHEVATGEARTCSA